MRSTRGLATGVFRLTFLVSARRWQRNVWRLPALSLLALGVVLLAVSVAYAAASDLDVTWDTDGKIVVNLSAEELPHEVIVDPDGKVVVAVQRNATEGDLTTARGRLMRFLSNGALDTSFAGDGVFELPLQGTESDIIEAVVRQNDGNRTFA